MKNPCINCITLSICRAAVPQGSMVDMRRCVFNDIFEKCSLLREFILYVKEDRVHYNPKLLNTVLSYYGRTVSDEFYN